MDEIFSKIDDMGPVKECIGCGFCCLKTKCMAGQRLYPSADKCPALRWNGERHTCELMELPGAVGEAYRAELYAGEGCCANLNSWYYEPLRDRTKPKVDQHKNPLPSIMQKFLVALGNQMVSNDVLFLTVSGFGGLLIKDGMSEDEAKLICSRCLELLKGSKNKIFEDFLG